MLEQWYNPKVIHTYRRPTDHPHRRLCQRKSLVSRVFKDFETTYTCSAPATSGKSFGCLYRISRKATFETRKRKETGIKERRETAREGLKHSTLCLERSTTVYPCDGLCYLRDCINKMQKHERQVLSCKSRDVKATITPI